MKIEIFEFGRQDPRASLWVSFGVIYKEYVQ